MVPQILSLDIRLSVRRSGVIFAVVGSVLVWLLAGACAGRRHPAAEPVRIPAGQCERVPAPSVAPRSLAVAVTAPLDADGLWSEPNAGQRLVLALAYERLVTLDCGEDVLPGLAASWRWDSTGEHWVFVLRDDIRFWSGERIGAPELLAAWRDAAVVRGDETLASMVEAVTILDDRTLAISIPREELARLADPTFAVRRAGADSIWPEGTGAFRVRRDAGGPGSMRTALHLEPARGDSGPRLTIHDVPVTVARDLIDAGLDVLLTDDFDLVRYAGARPDVRGVALPWNRTYALVTALRSTGTAGTPPAADGMLAAREAMARNVVGGDARGATEPFWWRGPASCGIVPPPESPAPLSMRVAYDRGDPVARVLAERVVAVAGMPSARDDAGALLPPALLGSGSRLRAIGLGRAQLAASLRAGGEAAWIVGLERQASSRCLARERLAQRAPWLALSADDTTTGIVPLVETRWHVLLRDDRVGLMLGGDGAPHLLFRAASGGVPQP